MPLARVSVGAALAVAVVLPLSAVPANAEGVDDLPEIGRAQLQESVHSIQPEVHAIEPRVSPLERETSSGAIALNSDILFGFDRAAVTPAAKKRLADIVEDIPKGASVTITGYTDDVGGDAYNQKLSTQRARSVEKALDDARPDLDTTARGRGSADPVAPNTKGGEDNPEGRAQNRRVEISHD
ncbi:OmpA family protein [Janibacter corallicola]|uniref:OmpA family protein n=1 Tax=Janibacter corallicola TaxID=415212 RepID=UPI00082CA801|nr:OmpA family protein [Janibacter corallicola]